MEEKIKKIIEIFKAIEKNLIIEVKYIGPNNTISKNWYNPTPENPELNNRVIYDGLINGIGYTPNLYEYRIKPEPKYRPYNNAEEFLEHSKKHGSYLKPQQDNIYFIPLSINVENNYLIFNSKSYNRVSFKELLDNNWFWQDGIFCGVPIED